jgi:hypothetical protein
MPTCFAIAFGAALMGLLQKIIPKMKLFTAAPLVSEIVV